MPNTNKIALITGASSGIGKSLSLELCKKGYELILSSRNIDLLNKTSDAISRLGGKAHIIDVDISDDKSVEKLFLKSQKIGFVDVVINNAGFGKFDKIEDLSIYDWDRQMSINLRGSFLLTKFFSNPMIRNKKGTIVFVNSVAGKKAYPYSSAYVASKFGLLGFSRSIRGELRKHNIKVISVHPGAVDTAFWENVDVDFPRDKMMNSDNVAKTIVHAISAPENIVLEEIDIQRTEGDF